MSTINAPVSHNQKSIQETVQHPQWLDKQLYPFQSHFVEIEGNRIHYIDEGSGPIVLFVHPGFGWSFTNREIIKGLRDRYRVKMGWLRHKEDLFPKHCSIVLQGSYHFPQEYDPASVVTDIRRWLDEEMGS